MPKHLYVVSRIDTKAAACPQQNPQGMWSHPFTIPPKYCTSFHLLWHHLILCLCKWSKCSTSTCCLKHAIKHVVTVHLQEVPEGRPDPSHLHQCKKQYLLNGKLQHCTVQGQGGVIRPGKRWDWWCLCCVLSLAQSGNTELYLRFHLHMSKLTSSTGWGFSYDKETRTFYILQSFTYAVI